MSWTELDRLNFASSVVLEATRRYRHRALASLAEESLTVWGDSGWNGSLPVNVKLLPVVDYYRELPTIYRQTSINLNFTSLQMPTAVNQRVFDVPASGGFLLTDDQDDLHQLFRNNELATFSSLEELSDRVRYFLIKIGEREAISSRARARILSEHTYLHRVRKLIAEAKKRFARTAST
jgi:spore maturation protein CgeB